MPAELRIRQRRGWFGFGGGPAVDRASFDALMEGARATPAADRSKYDDCGAARPSQLLRVRRPDDDSPWFTAQWVPSGDGGGEIQLGSSYTDPRFVRNWVDLVDRGVRLAGAAQGEVVDDDQTVLTAAKVDSLLVQGSAYVTRHASVHAMVMKQLADAGGVPMEYALGGVIDRTSVQFVLHLGGSTPVSARWVADRVALDAADDERGVVRDADGEALLRVFVRPDGKLQLWGAFERAPFARWSRAAADLADAAVADGIGAELVGFGPWPAVRDEVAPQIGGLGCDYVAWALARAKSLRA